MLKQIRVFILGIVALLLAGMAVSETAAEEERDEIFLSLEDLFNLEITSVSKKEERLQDVATSIYVITEEDIRRSGAVRLQDLLNLAPGVWFADNSYWTPNNSIRETPDYLPQSINVLLDGIPLNSPITGGVYYNILDIPIDRISRIEIIKGPGGTIYGANSATGIVNIICKEPGQSPGLSLKVDGGTQEYVKPMISYDGRLKDDLEYSVFASYKRHHGYDRNPDFSGATVIARSVSGTDTVIDNKFTSDEVGFKHSIHYGAKVKADLTGNLLLTAGASAFNIRGKDYSTLTSGFPETPGPKPDDSLWVEDIISDNVLVNTRLDYAFDENHHAFLHMFYRFEGSRSHGMSFGTSEGNVQLADIELQDNLVFFRDRPLRLELIYGANTRIIKTRLEDTGGLMKLKEPDNVEYIIAGFVQNKISFGDLIDLTTGAKAETWTLIGNEPEISPNIRLAVKPNPRITAWGAWSRSITTPGFIQTKAEIRVAQAPPAWYFTSPPPAGLGMPPSMVPPGAGKWIALVNSDEMKPSDYRTAEAGIRTSLIPKTTFDISGYYTRYKDKIVAAAYDETLNEIIPSAVIPGDTIIPLYYTNLARGVLYGAETVIRIAPFDRLRLEVSHSWFRHEEEAQVLPDTDDTLDVSIPDKIMPHHVFRYRLYMDLPYELFVTFNGQWHTRYRDAGPYDYVNQSSPDDPAQGLNKDKMEPRLKFDVTIEKAFMDDRLTLSVWGKNIFSGHTIEAFSPYMVPYPHTAHRTFGSSMTYEF